MSVETDTAARPRSGEAMRELRDAVLRVLIPVLLALAIGGVILLILGKNPLEYYGYVLRRGLLTWGGLQETFTRMAPLLLIAAGLIVAFRAGIWNLGADGQFLLSAVVTAALVSVPILTVSLNWSMYCVLRFGELVVHASG